MGLTLPQPSITHITAKMWGHNPKGETGLFPPGEGTATGRRDRPTANRKSTRQLGGKSWCSSPQNHAVSFARGLKAYQKAVVNLKNRLLFLDSNSAVSFNAYSLRATLCYTLRWHPTSTISWLLTYQQVYSKMLHTRIPVEAFDVKGKEKKKLVTLTFIKRGLVN